MSQTYYIFVQGFHTEPRMVLAKDGKDAAANWVMQYEQAQVEYKVASGREDMIVHVFSEEEYNNIPTNVDPSWLEFPHETFIVSGETVPVYYAKKMGRK